MVSRAANRYLRIASILCLCLYTPYAPALYAKQSKRYKTQKKKNKKSSQFKNVVMYLLPIASGVCIILYVTHNKNSGSNNTSPHSKPNAPKDNSQSKPPSTSFTHTPITPIPVLQTRSIKNKNAFNNPHTDLFTIEEENSDVSQHDFSDEEKKESTSLPKKPSPEPVPNDGFPAEEIQKLQKEIAEIKQKRGLASDLITKKKRFKELIESSKPWKECYEISKEAGAQYDEKSRFLIKQSTESINNYLSDLNKDKKVNLNREFQTNYNKIKGYANTHNGLSEQYKAFQLFIQLTQGSLNDKSSKVDDLVTIKVTHIDIKGKFVALKRKEHKNAYTSLKGKIALSHKSPEINRKIAYTYLYKTLINIYNKVKHEYEFQNKKNNIQEISAKKEFWFKPDKNTNEFNQNAQNLITKVENKILENFSKEVEKEILKELPSTLDNHEELVQSTLKEKESPYRKFITESVAVCFYIVSNQDPGLEIKTDITDEDKKVTYYPDNDYNSNDYNSDDDDSDDDAKEEEKKKAENFKKNYKSVVSKIKKGAKFDYIVFPPIYSKNGDKLSQTYAVFSNNI